MTTTPVKSIPEFYARQSIFLTGATGFLGKVFIEKVLRCCPDVREIFLLIRPKKNLSIEDRMKNMINLPLFDRLREEKSLSFKKLVPILGDTKEDNLGLSTIDRQMLTERVSIIIHSAASVRFNETLTNSVFMHVRATKDICILAQNMKNLIALVYVSTTFTNIENTVVEEKVYPSVTDWRKMIKIAEHLDKNILNIFTAKYINSSPNTYIFTKKLAESVIEEYSSSLPCAIVRPSVVLSSLNDPFPGWIDNLYGPIGQCFAIGKGILRVIYCNKNSTLNTIPVDFVIKTIVATPWRLGMTSFVPDSTPFVINCIHRLNVLSESFCKVMIAQLKKIPVENIVWTLNVIYTESYIIFYILTILLHVVPAVSIDLILKLSGRKPMLLKIMRNLYVASLVLNYFSNNYWEYIDANNLAMMSLMSPDDREIFSFDSFYFDFKKYATNNIIGGKKFLFHEDMNRLDAAKAHYKRVVLGVTILKTIIIFGILWMLYKYFYSYMHLVH